MARGGEEGGAGRGQWGGGVGWGCVCRGRVGAGNQVGWGRLFRWLRVQRRVTRGAPYRITANRPRFAATLADWMESPGLPRRGAIGVDIHARR